MAKKIIKPVKKAAPKPVKKAVVKQEKKPEPKPEAKAKGSIKDFKGNVYSQNGEDNIIAEAIKRIGLTGGQAREVGAPTKQYCSNTYNLPNTFEKKYFDSNPQEEGIKKVTVSTDNVNYIIGECDILSIDTDGADYGIWKAYTGNPAIVVIEVNSSIHPDHNEPVNDPERGTGFKPMNELAESKGYFLLCHTGNCLYCLNKYIDLFPDRDESFDKSWL